MTEKTVVTTMELPHGRDWLWFADLNVVALAPHLDAEGQDRALQEVTAWWRRSGLRLVSAAGTAATVLAATAVVVNESGIHLAALR